MLTNLPAYLANSKKAIIQVITLVLTVASALTSLGLLSDEQATVLATIVGVLGSILHYMVGNAPAPGTVEAEEVDDVPVNVVLHNAEGDEVPNDEPDDDELDEGPVVDEVPVVTSVASAKHEA